MQLTRRLSATVAFSIVLRIAADAQRETGLQKAVFAAVTGIDSDTGREAAVRRLYRAAKDGYGRAFSEEDIAPVLTPWMRTLLRIDPQSLLGELRCQVLALVGEKDQVVQADANVPALMRALAGNPRAQVQRLPGLNHFFRPAPASSRKWPGSRKRSRRARWR